MSDLNDYLQMALNNCFVKDVHLRFLSYHSALSLRAREDL